MRDVAAEIRERGYAVFEGAFAPNEVDAFKGELAAKYEALGSPRTWARPPEEPGPDVEISVVGMVFHKLGNHAPGIVPRLFKPELVGAVRDVLGDDMHLEYTSAVVNAGERPFFPWHAHQGGVDNATYRKQGIFPRYERCERLAMLVYLDDLDEAIGTLLVMPRRIDEPTEPPFEDPSDPDWPGRAELRLTRGSVVLMDQSVWHAARGKATEGLRAFIACFFTASCAPETSWIDDSVRSYADRSPVLASVLP